jgi:hypothetical protein
VCNKRLVVAHAFPEPAFLPLMRIRNRCILKLYSVRPAVNSQPGFRQGLIRQVPCKDMDKYVKTWTGWIGPRIIIASSLLQIHHSTINHGRQSLLLPVSEMDYTIQGNER